MHQNAVSVTLSPREITDVIILCYNCGRYLKNGNKLPIMSYWASVVAQLVKNPPACERPGFDSWVGKIPWRQERLPTPASWPRGFHGL